MAGNKTETKALLHFDGSDAATTITDDAEGAAHAWIASANAQLDTADQQFGTAALLCDGTDDHVYAGDSTDWQFGAGEFCIDLWAKLDGAETFGVNRRGLISYAGDYGWSPTGIEWMLVVGPSGFDAVRFEIYNGTSTPNRLLSYNAVLTGWHHYCVCYDGTTAYLFVDGVLVDSAAFSGMTHPASMATPRLRVGAVQDSGGGTYDWNGWIDEVRVQKGTSGIFDPYDPLYIQFEDAARGFTPPASPYDATVEYFGYLARVTYFQPLASLFANANARVTSLMPKASLYADAEAWVTAFYLTTVYGPDYIEGPKPTAYFTGPPFLIGTGNGRIYAMDDDVVASDGTVRTSYTTTGFGEMCARKLNFDGFGKTGGSYTIKLYKNHDRTTPVYTKTGNLPDETLAEDLDNFLDRFNLNINFRTLQIEITLSRQNDHMHIGPFTLLVWGVGGL